MSTETLSPTEKSHRQKTWLRSKSALFAYGLLVGALVILGIRFFTYDPPHTHYHANFAVYINGQREQFKDSTYYEDVAACSAFDNMTPLERVHMHDGINDVVHVHDHAVTWGQFFENIGWYVGDNFIKTHMQMYVASGNSQLHIMINGQDYTNLTPITNMVIGDQSKLLVSFGDVSSTTLHQEYSAIKNNAKHDDEEQDPASCSGNIKPNTSDRLKHLF
ncbi:MAG: hypothetical protein ACQR33_04750 [Candidatus Saccharibacteria bacterium]